MLARDYFLIYFCIAMESVSFLCKLDGIVSIRWSTAAIDYFSDIWLEIFFGDPGIFDDLFAFKFSELLDALGEILWGEVSDFCAWI